MLLCSEQLHKTNYSMFQRNWTEVEFDEVTNVITL